MNQNQTRNALIVGAALAVFVGYRVLSEPAESPKDVAAGQAADHLVTARAPSKPPAGKGKGKRMKNGLLIEDLKTGTGPEAKKGQSVKVHYTGWLENNTKFDSSFERNEPFPFVLGAGDVIRGWDEGVVGMKVGGQRKLTIPPHLAYRAEGFPPSIPPYATLIFEVELVEVSPPEAGGKGQKGGEENRRGEQ